MTAGRRAGRPTDDTTQPKGIAVSDQHATEAAPVSVTLPLPQSFLTSIAMVTVLGGDGQPVTKVTASAVTDYGRSGIDLFKLQIGPLVAQLNEAQWRAAFSALNQAIVASGGASLVQVFGPADAAEAAAVAESVESERAAQ